MAKLFFSHAKEDKGRVLQVYGKLLEHYPELDVWVDTFEIVGGQDLLDKIAAGMDEAERFFIFLSPVSVDKPWVQAELKRALTQEITRIKPEYVVPVKIGGLQRVPPFMENKKYIDLENLTEAEWVGEFYAASTGGQLSKDVPNSPNLQWAIALDPARPNVVQFGFTVQHWAVEPSFKIPTTVPAVKVEGRWASEGPVGSETFAKLLVSNYAGWASGHRLLPGRDFRITLTFADHVDAQSVVGEPEVWDGSGAESSGMLFL